MALVAVRPCAAEAAWAFRIVSIAFCLAAHHLHDLRVHVADERLQVTANVSLIHLGRLLACRRRGRAFAPRRERQQSHRQQNNGERPPERPQTSRHGAVYPGR